eukprot:CAMPEP_0204525250 /NCGR_PEP_ID=MMETSP0661-20131031/7810_1 /ASSEMBLY_ACC=CAM_ASM_000606 /TAXON_ID=109239 /ORGANISM="Alexandrium margalefi, Strain AMGDE01CS-322" /LENGTH=242 /DNA_ID=CAMNT_0051531043 /DNA_START=16 /DNA_END=744 /DNA_ORIENTATION=-
MTPQDVQTGESVIEQGSVGSMFYIIEWGSFEVFMSSDDVSPPGIKVGELGPGDSFGELALLYSKARSATVVATTRARLWVMERAAFQAAVAKGWNQDLPSKFIDFMDTVPLFRGISDDKKLQLGRALLPKWYSEGEAIIKQGDWEERFFVLRMGEATAVEELPDGEREVETYSGSGAVIGSEVLRQEYRQQSRVTVRSNSDITVVFWMSKLTFDEIMGEEKEEALAQLEASYSGEKDQCVCM